MKPTRKETKKLIWSNMPDFECCVDKKRGRVCDCAYQDLRDERINLNVRLPGEVVVIADIGTWRGRVAGYKVLNDLLSSMFDVTCDYNEFYSDGHNIRSRQVHHDGTNYLLFRMLRPDMNPEPLFRRILDDSFDQALINRYTVSLHPYVAEVYGWKSRPKAKV